MALVTLLAGLLAAGCGKDERSAQAEAPAAFERALERVGEGFSPTGTGYGWIDLDTGPPAATVAGALGPGAADLLERTNPLRAVGVDLSEAEAATSIAASYGYAVRLDGAAAGRLPRLLRAAGASSRRVGEWTSYDLGKQWQAPLRGPLAGLQDFAARVAVSADAVILSRTDRGREALRDVGSSPLEAPEVAFAARCLGEVGSARTLPGTFTHNAAASPELIAIGVRPGAAREVLCAIGSSPELAEGWERALTDSFAAGAEEPLSGEPISRSVSEADVDRLEEAGLYAARAEIALAEGERPGFLYGALVRGSVLPYVGAPEPVPEGT